MQLKKHSTKSLEMQSDKEYFLDVNHNPVFLNIDSSSSHNRLRSGDDISISRLSELNFFFANHFGCKNATFLDFSPSSICAFLEEIVPKNTILAASVKLSYFCIEGLRLYAAKQNKLLWIEAEKSGSLSKKSIKRARESGAELFFCSLVDEDTFFIEDTKLFSEYFDTNKCIFDISNAINHVKIPEFFAAIAWGHKLASFKKSGLALYNESKSLLLDNIDLIAYEHFFRAFNQNISTSKKELITSFIDGLLQNLGSDVYFYVEPKKCLGNSVCVGFRGVRARDFIRALAIEGIYVTNGELCSLALSKPSRILQSLGYAEEEARNAISFSFGNDIEANDISFLVSKLSFKYKQIKAILQD